MTPTVVTAPTLRADHTLAPTRIVLEQGRIAALEPVSAAPAGTGSLLALPGIVDLHGDAFERQLMPRPGVHFPPVAALLETDRQMLGNGITTAYHGLTLSWEPGLRGADAARAFLAGLEAARPRLGCDTRLHLRFETYNLDMVDEVIGWIAAGRIDLLAFNEHTQDLADGVRGGKPLTYLARTQLTESDFVALLARVCARAGEVPAAVARLAQAAAQAGLPTASHDDDTPEERLAFRDLGCRICEFPKDEATARTAVGGGDWVILGAPNVMRGKSHIGRLGAIDGVAAGLCSILTSDYYYPMLLLAPFRLAETGVATLAKAWDLVSRNPARAVGLADRGEIAPGRRADLVLVDVSDPALPTVAATIAGGDLAYARGAAFAALG